MNLFSKQIGLISEKVCKDDATEKHISKYWKEFFTCYLKELNFNKSAIEELFKWHGVNRDNLKGMSKSELRVRFQWEVSYIFDRLCLDRLFRAHWIYNEYIDKT